MNTKKVNFVARPNKLQKKLPYFLLLKILMGDVITGMSGTQGGTTYAKNTYGSYKRSVGVRVNKDTDAQQIVRERFSTIASRWRTLTVDQRNTWYTLAPTYNRLDVFGNNHPLTAPTLYQRINSNAIKVGGSFVDECPVPVVPASIPFTSITPSAGGGDITIVLPNAVPSGYAGYLSMSPTLSAGISFNRTKYKNVQTLLLADTATIDVASNYELIYGPAWQDNQGCQLMAKLEIVEIATGLPSAIAKGFGIIGA